MKKIEAIIRHNKLDEVRDALDQLGVHGMTISEVTGAGTQKGYTENYRGARNQIHLLPKIKIESVVEDGRADLVVQTIVGTARTGDIGDGKIFVIPIDTAVRIRTGETDLAAI